MKRALASLGILFGVAAPSNARGVRERITSTVHFYRATIAAGKFTAFAARTGFEVAACSRPESSYDTSLTQPALAKLISDDAGFHSFTQTNLFQHVDRRAALNRNLELGPVSEWHSLGDSAPKWDALYRRTF